jgi:hypothetical protein
MIIDVEILLIAEEDSTTSSPSPVTKQTSNAGVSGLLKGKIAPPSAGPSRILQVPGHGGWATDVVIKTTGGPGQGAG